MATNVENLNESLKKKAAEKYDEGLEKSLREWIHKVLQREVSPTGKLSEELKDGVMLCQLLNALVPDSVKRINQNTNMAFKHMENISNFLAVAQKWLPDHTLFRTIDLYEAKDLLAVWQGISNIRN